MNLAGEIELNLCRRLKIPNRFNFSLDKVP